MKKLMMIVMVLGASSAFAAEDSFVPAQVELSSSCQKKIVTATIRQCNSDSKHAEGSDRMHPCIESESSVTVNHPESARFELSYTAGDADVYSYEVVVTDKSSCDFTFKAD